MTAAEHIHDDISGNSDDFDALIQSQGAKEIDDLMFRAGSFGRLPTLLEQGEVLPDDEWLALLGRHWSCCDGISACKDELWGAFDWRSRDENGHFRTSYQMMTAMERSAFEQLPDEITIYRGCYACNKWGFSWSLDRDVAERFPFLNRYRNTGRPLLVKATLKKSAVVALKLDRGESEIITICKPKCISISTARHRQIEGGAA